MSPVAVKIRRDSAVVNRLYTELSTEAVEKNIGEADDPMCGKGGYTNGFFVDKRMAFLHKASPQLLSPCCHFYWPEMNH